MVVVVTLLYQCNNDNNNSDEKRLLVLFTCKGLKEGKNEWYRLVRTQSV
jgi:hypothetical protein